MKMHEGKFYLGVAILVFLAISYFIKFPIEQGANYITKSSLLGILILNNPFVLVFYIFVSVVFIAKGLKND